METEQLEALQATIANFRNIFERKLIGQPQAIAAIAPMVEVYQASLAPEGRPAGVILLLGPTGTGKTRTVEALAESLHGTEKHLLRVDCAEYQLEHEVAKLIGAPPGYLGHRETQPLLTQLRLNAVASDRSSLSIVLFDEIEKAAPSFQRLLLGVLDRAQLRLGDNSSVNFERTLVFMTSNLGAREIQRSLNPTFGLCKTQDGNHGAMATSAASKHFSPEFMNRIDSVITYNTLTRDDIGKILDMQLVELQRHVIKRLGIRAVRVDVSTEARGWLVDNGTSPLHGARELKRLIQRRVLHPVAQGVISGAFKPGSTVTVGVEGGEVSLCATAGTDTVRRSKRAAGA